MADQQQSACEPIPPGCEVIEVHAAELKQLFNAIDPSPFREKDLDVRVEEFIVEWARDLPRDAKLALLVHLDRSAELGKESEVLRAAIREFFSRRSESSQRRLRHLFRVGRTSLLIGTGFLTASFLASNFVMRAYQGLPLSDLLRESLLIGGWVAMWRPLEIFLYDWWPIQSEVRLYDRLSAMPVQIQARSNPETR